MRPGLIREAITSRLQNIRAAGSTPRPQSDGRHGVPLERLLQDKDPRFRPSPQLVEIMKTGPWTGFRGYLELDRPLVPLLNALVERGFRPRSSCVDAYLSIDGVTATEAQVLTDSVVRRLPGTFLRWGIDENEPRGSTTAFWMTAQLPDPATPATMDATLLAAADDVRAMSLTPGPIRPEAALAMEIREHLLATDPARASYVRIGQADPRDAFYPGFRVQIDHTPTDIGIRHAPTLQGLKSQLIQTPLELK